MADVIIQVCPQPDLNQPDFQDRCNNLVGAGLDGNDAAVLNTTQVVSPEQIAAQGTQMTRTSAGQLSTVSGALTARLAALRATLSSGVSLSYNGSSPSTLSGGAAGDEADPGFSRWGAFVNVSYNKAEVDSTFNLVGFDVDTWGITGGADYRLTDKLVLGGALSYQSSDADYNNSAGSTDGDSYTGSIFGSFYPSDNLYVDAIASVGWVDYDTKRQIQYSIAPNSVDSEGDTVNATAKGSPDGNQYSIGIGAGYLYSRGALTLTPHAGLNWTRLDLDGYRENGGSGWAMEFDDQEVKSLTSVLGARASYAANQSWGVLLPQVSAAWHHEFEDDQREISTRFLGTSSPLTFDTVTDKPDRDYFIVGASLSAQMPHGTSAYIAYTGLVGYDDVSSHLFTAGFRKEF